VNRGILRTALASGLVAITLIVPFVAWFVAGHREVEREAERLEQAPRRLASESAHQLATRLEQRLEALLERESRRPYYHYQSFYHDPEGASEGASVVPSPLAGGGGDPLILAHVQVDERGRATTPDSKTSRVLLAAMAPAAGELLRDAGGGAARGTDERLLATGPATEAKKASSVQTLDLSAYQQNVRASQLFTDLRRSQGESRQQLDLPSSPPARRPIVIEVGAFEWRTLSFSSVRTLAALRAVRTPQTRMVQGFVVDTAEVARDLAATQIPARFVAGPPMEAMRAGGPSGDASVVAVPLEGTGWSVVVQPSTELGRAHTEAAALRARFTRTFTAGLIAASVAGLCVIALVWQSERLARQRSQFAAAAAHELRTPLAGLRLYGEMLAEGLGDPVRAQGYAHAVGAEADRLGRVVSNMLGFTRLERGTMAVRLEPGDLATVVREAVARQSGALEAAGARVVLSVNGELPKLRFDTDAVHHMLQNLLDNAERHAREAADRTIEVSLANAGAGAVLTVADRGPGVPAPARGRLFRAFERRGDGAATAGLGIGLALVRALAREHGGAVAYQPRAGGGAVFSVTFPAAS
jgi:signal transduction histidine kinase